MKMAVFLASMALPASVAGTDLSYLARSGWAVAGETTVRGEFQGCEHGKIIPLATGNVFVCGSYNYHYAYNPPFMMLKNVKYGGAKFLIDGEEFEGMIQ